MHDNDTRSTGEIPSLRDLEDMYSVQTCDGCEAEPVFGGKLPSGIELLFCEPHRDASTAKLAEMGVELYRLDSVQLSVPDAS